MATSTPSQTTANDVTTPASSKLKLIPSFPKQVFLYDWWLIKADTPSDGRVLGVGGLSSNEQLGVRILHSAAIVKRHNTNTVETADGLKITFSGSINKSRTLLNGFSSGVCSRFIFGFPYSWEEFSSESFANEARNRAVDNSADAANNLPKSFDNLPGALIRDFFLSTIESSGTVKLGDIFEDMLQTYRGESFIQRAEFLSRSKEINQVTKDSAEDETCSNRKKMKAKQKQKDENDISGGKPRKRFQRAAREVGVGPSTRSMSRSKVASSKQEEENLLSSLVKSQPIKSVFSSEAPPRKQYGGSVTGRERSSQRSSTRISPLRNCSIDLNAKGRRLTLRNRSIDFNVEDRS